MVRQARGHWDALADERTGCDQAGSASTWGGGFA
jgi:hypothetical protein